MSRLDLSKFQPRELSTEFIDPEAVGDSRYSVPQSGDLLFVFAYEPGEVGPTHTHEETHLVFVRSGRVRYTVGDATRDVGAGEIVAMLPGVPHSYEALGGEGARVAELVILP